MSEKRGASDVEVATLKAKLDAAVRDLEVLMGENLSTEPFRACKFCASNGGVDCPLSSEEECHPRWRGLVDQT